MIPERISAVRQVLENKPEIARRFVKAHKAFSFKALRKYLKTDDSEAVEEATPFTPKVAEEALSHLKGIQAILYQLAKTNPDRRQQPGAIRQSTIQNKFKSSVSLSSGH